MSEENKDTVRFNERELKALEQMGLGIRETLAKRKRSVVLADETWSPWWRKNSR